MAEPDPEPDPERLKQYSYNVFMQLSGAVTAGMIHLGDRLGIYAALKHAGGPLGSAALADACGLDERWVREWAANQASAGLVTVEGLEDAPPPGASTPGGERYGLSPEAAAVLASPDHPAAGTGMFYRFPQLMATLELMPDSFRTGLGHDYDSHGADGAIGIERSFEPWNRHHLVPDVLPAMDGLIERLESGIAVADIGCGAGGAVLMLAERFPNSSFVGYDISRHALDRAESRRTDAGLVNARFADPRDEPLPDDGSLGFVTTFDCIHDMAHPDRMIDAIARAIGSDGTWLLVDIRGRNTLAENVEKNPMAALMYGVSVLSCMSSALSEPDGAGLGTLGLPEQRAEHMARAAGFTSFRRLDIDHAVNAFYEIRP